MSKPAPQAVQAQALERTPKDYAIEHAEYMAKSAEHLLAALSSEGAALTTEELEDAILRRCESVKSLHSAIYEFRKRWDRARSLASASDAAHPLQPLSDLTAAELDAEEDSKLLELSDSELINLMADAVQADPHIRSAPNYAIRNYTIAVIAALRVRLGKESGNA